MKESEIEFLTKMINITKRDYLDKVKVLALTTEINIRIKTLKYYSTKKIKG